MDVEQLEKDCCRVSLDLNSTEAEKIRPFKPGQEVQLLVVGKITAQSFYAENGPKETGYDGHLSLDISKVSVMKAPQKTQIEKLFEDEEN